MIMNDEAIKELAEYLTGPAVTASSVNLQVGGINAKIAGLFFILRGSFGVRGYISADEATEVIKKVLNNPRKG